MSDQEAPPPSTATDAGPTSMYELFIGALIFVSIAGMLITYFLKLFFPDSPIITILIATDTLYCVIFLVDFTKNLIAADKKRDYLFWRGTLDFLGSIPALPALRLFRVFRLVRLSRLIRTRGARGLLRDFVDRRAEGALYLTALLAMLMLSICSSLVLAFENHDPNANLHTGGNAYWWAYVTITTVGYGDFYPVTRGGRVVGMALMTFGIGIFGVLTSFMSSLFLAPPKPKKSDSKPAPAHADSTSQTVDPRRLQEELSSLRDELAQIKALLQGQQSA